MTVYPVHMLQPIPVPDRTSAIHRHSPRGSGEISRFARNDHVPGSVGGRQPSVIPPVRRSLGEGGSRRRGISHRHAKFRFRLITLPILALLLACTATLSHAADWPQWRGPTHDGISEESSGWPDAWPPRELWRKSVGPGCSSPIIADGKLYTMGWENTSGGQLRTRPLGKDIIYCFDATTGQELWRREYPCHYQARTRLGDVNAYGGPSATPSYDPQSGHLYTLSTDGHLNCWDVRQEARRVWGMELQERFRVEQRPSVGGGQRDFGFTTAPLLHGDKLVVQVGSSKETVVGFDKRTGQVAWSSQYDGPAGHTAGLVPLVTQGSEYLAVLTLQDLVFMGLSGSSAGKTLAKHRWATDYGCNIPTPAVWRDRLIITSEYNHKSSQAIRFTAHKVAEEWTSEQHALVSSPVVFGKRVFLVNRTLRACSSDDGTLLWKGGSFGDGSCLITSADSKAIVFGGKRLALVDIAPEVTEYRELSRIDNIVSAICYPHVALSDGILACKDRDGHLVVFALKDTPDAAKVVATEKVARPPVESVPLKGDNPVSQGDLVFVWKLKGAANMIPGEGTQPAQFCRLRGEGNATFARNGAMETVSGAFVAEDADARLLSACRQSNQLTVEAMITPENASQEGPARIISSSESPYARNFTLGQTRDRFIFRLRTSGNDKNGTKPEVTLCQLQAGKPQHVIVTYQPGELHCYLDGTQVLDTDKVQGDFSNWSPQHLIFGDEWTRDRKWRGTLSHIAIHSRVIGPEEAAMRAKLATADAISTKE